MKFFSKRNKRVWTKKVKYDVRKNFADSRVRVKGRFVKKEDEEILMKEHECVVNRSRSESMQINQPLSELDLSKRSVDSSNLVISDDGYNERCVTPITNTDNSIDVVSSVMSPSSHVADALMSLAGV